MNYAKRLMSAVKDWLATVDLFDIREERLSERVARAGTTMDHFYQTSITHGPNSRMARAYQDARARLIRLEQQRVEFDRRSRDRHPVGSPQWWRWDRRHQGSSRLLAEAESHPHEPSPAVERTQPIHIHPLQLTPPGDERYEQAVQAVREAEARLEQIHAEHHQLMSWDPEWGHSLREPEPDWPGGVASAEDLESWAGHLQDCADRREAEAAQAHADDERRRAEWRERELAAEEWDRSPYNPGNYSDPLDWALNNPHQSNRDIYRRVGTHAELSEAVAEATERGGAALIECEEFDPTAPDHHSETAAAGSAAQSQGEPVSLPWLHMRERGELDSASQHNPDGESGQDASTDTRSAGQASEFDRLLAGIDDALADGQQGADGEAEAQPATRGSWSETFDRLSQARHSGMPVGELERRAVGEFDRLSTSDEPAEHTNQADGYGPSELPLPWLHVNEPQSKLSAAERADMTRIDARLEAHRQRLLDQVRGRENLADAVQGALTDSAANPVDEAEAREVLAEADELNDHLDSCELDFEQCRTCAPEVDGSREEFWRNRVPAAEATLDRAESAALLDPPEFDGHYDTAPPAQDTEHACADAGERDADEQVLWPGADGTRILAKQRIVNDQVVAEYCDPNGFVIGESTRPLAQGESADQVADHFIDSLPEQATRPRFGPSITPEHKAALDRHHPNDPEVTRERTARRREQARAASPELARLWDRAVDGDQVSMADRSEADAETPVTPNGAGRGRDRDRGPQPVAGELTALVGEPGERVPGTRGFAAWTDRLLREVSSPGLSHRQRIQHLDRYAKRAWDLDAVKAAERLARSMEIARGDLERIPAPGQPRPELTPPHTHAILERARADMAREVAADAAEPAAQRHARLTREAKSARQTLEEPLTRAGDYESPDERDRRYAAQARYEALVDDRDAAAQQLGPAEQETTRERTNSGCGCGPAVAAARHAVDRLCHQPGTGKHSESHDSPRQVRHAEADSAGDAAGDDETGWIAEGGLER